MAHSFVDVTCVCALALSDFKGGGWCTAPDLCAKRAGGLLGSSNTLLKHQPTFEFGGPLDTDPAMNPAFAHFHHVVLWYCDGGSFSGDRADPQVVDGANIWCTGLPHAPHLPTRSPTLPRS